MSLFQTHSESIGNVYTLNGSVVRLVDELSYLNCSQNIYCCVLDSVQ